MNHVRNTAVKIVNFITAKAINYRKFIPMLQDLDAEYTHAPCQFIIQWLCLGKVLKKFGTYKKKYKCFWIWETN